MFRFGNVVELNYSKALEWYRLSADQGSELAQDAIDRLRLALMQ